MRIETALQIALRADEPEVAKGIAAAAAGLAPRISQPWLTSVSEDPILPAGASWSPVFQSGDCGYFGDPGQATRELGDRLADVLADGLAAFFDQFASTPLKVGVSRDPLRPQVSPPL